MNTAALKSPTLKAAPPSATLDNLIGKSIFDMAFSTPMAVLRRSVIEQNANWMNQFVDRYGISIAPHGKTSMSPEIFRFQIAAGAEWMTLASARQAQVAREAGATKILIANQIINAQDLDYVARETAADPSLEIQLFVDSIAGVHALAEAVSRARPARNIGVMLEIGVAGGRAGVRSRETALQVAEAVKTTTGLELVGLAGYEGVYTPKEADCVEKVDRYLRSIVSLAEDIGRRGLFRDGAVILSAGGSKFFDRVAEIFLTAKLTQRPQVQLRCGCYLFHDIGIYEEAFRFIVQRNDVARSLGELKPSMEIVAAVQSRPEDGRAIVNMGRRDVSYDAGLPVPIYFVPQGTDQQVPLQERHVLSRLNDQHGFMDLPSDSPIQIGDMIGFGISHPCTVFDKWRSVHVVDDNHRLVSIVHTQFS